MERDRGSEISELSGSHRTSDSKVWASRNYATPVPHPNNRGFTQQLFDASKFITCH
jgi:hypothetical protein